MKKYTLENDFISCTDNGLNDLFISNEEIVKLLNWYERRVSSLELTKEEKELLIRYRMLNDIDKKLISETTSSLAFKTDNISYLNTYRRNLQKELQKQGCCCENCYWCVDNRAKYNEDVMSDFYCDATKFDYPITNISKAICHRYMSMENMTNNGK